MKPPTPSRSRESASAKRKARKPRDHRHATLTNAYSDTWYVVLNLTPNMMRAIGRQDARKLGERLVAMADWIDAHPPAGKRGAR